MVDLLLDNIELTAEGIGAVCRTVRVASGKNQAEVAAEAGISISYLSLVERGRRMLALDKFARIIAVCGAEIGLTVKMEA